MTGYALTKPDSGEKTIASFAHILGCFFGFIAPLAMYIAKKDSPFVLEQTREALNFQLTVLIAYIFSLVLMLVSIGILTMVVTLVASMVLSYEAADKAGDGKDYRYPFTIQFVR